MLERFLEHVSERSGVWFPTLSELYDRWSD
jgi:hypothetical protein